jgi:hypothetical protein
LAAVVGKMALHKPRQRKVGMTATRPRRLVARGLVALGSNALALYAVSVLLFAFLFKPWQAALVRPLAAAAGATFAALAYSACTVRGAWMLAEWLYWRRVFVKV